MSKIRKVTAENFMRLRSVAYEPKDKGLTIVRGPNEGGKTTAITAPHFIMGGAGAAPPEPIRVGEEKAKLVEETDDFTATRRWWRTPEGIKTELKVVAKDGSPVKSPQALMDKYYPGDSDPTAFFKMKGPERREWLMTIVGVDPTLLDKAIEKVFGARTLVGRDLDAAKARLEAMPNEKPPPAVDMNALLKERGQLTNTQQLGAQLVAERNASMRRITDCEGAVETARQALAQAENRLKVAREQAAAADNAVDDAEEKVAGVPERLVELDALLQKASALATANAKWAEREKLDAEVKALDSEHASKTAQIEKLRKEKVELIANAKFPIDGLGFGDGDVTFNGLPLSQTSGAQRIRIGAAVLAARNPGLRFMRVPDGSLLDEANLAALNEFCEKHDWQCVVEIVGEDGPATIIIRDGAVYEPEAA